MRYALGLVAVAFIGVVAVVSAQSAVEGPTYNAAGELQRPANYREWVFLSAGLDMTYGPAAAALDANRNQLFNNVFVAPAAYRAFKATGQWPDKTMFILEIRRAEANVSINNRGRTQGGLAAIEAAVKDQARFKDRGGWGYFGFGDGTKPSGTLFGLDAKCNACHAQNTAVDNTFVQFYPELFAIATTKGTVKTTYDPNRKP